MTTLQQRINFNAALLISLALIHFMAHSPLAAITAKNLNLEIAADICLSVIWRGLCL